MRPRCARVINLFFFFATSGQCLAFCLTNWRCPVFSCSLSIVYGIGLFVTFRVKSHVDQRQRHMLAPLALAYARTSPPLLCAPDNAETSCRSSSCLEIIASPRTGQVADAMSSDAASSEPSIRFVALDVQMKLRFFKDCAAGMATPLANSAGSSLLHSARQTDSPDVSASVGSVDASAGAVVARSSQALPRS